MLATACAQRVGMLAARKQNTSALITEWLEAAQAGHCGVTRDLGDCDAGDKGSFGWDVGKTQTTRRAARWCLRQCASCSRCAFVSFSQKYSDCSWYAECDLSQLRPAPSGRKRDFLSGKMSPALLALPEWRVRQTVGENMPRAKSSAARDALRTLMVQRGGPSWLTPSHTLGQAGASVALCLFGKVGTLGDPASFTPADGGSPLVLHAVHAALRRRLIGANPHSVFEVFIHSWNPSLAATFDALYRPAWSLHEREYLKPPARSALRSLSRALRAKRKYEAARGRPFDLAVCLRHDLLFLEPLRLAALPAGQLWFAPTCCHYTSRVRGAPVPSAVTRAHAAMERTCMGEQGIVQELCRTSVAVASGRGDASKVTLEAERNYFLNDWIFVAPSATADTFAAIAPRYGRYVAVLDEVGISVKWMHFFFAAHVHAINATAGLRAGVHGIALVRRIPSPKGAGGDCASNVSMPLPPLEEPVLPGMENVCPGRGRIYCSQQHSLYCATGMNEPM